MSSLPATVSLASSRMLAVPPLRDMFALDICLHRCVFHWIKSIFTVDSMWFLKIFLEAEISNHGWFEFVEVGGKCYTRFPHVLEISISLLPLNGLSHV